MKRGSHALLMIPLALPALFWFEVAHRVWLYYSYGAQPYFNHVSDGYFDGMCSLSLVIVVALLVGLALTCWLHRIAAAMCACGLITMCGFMITLSYLHQAGILVTYSEFAQRLGP